MAMTTAGKNALALLLFNNTAWTNVGDAEGLRATAVAGTWSIALFTADPTVSGSVANEASYTSYDRVDIARSGAGFSVSGGVITPAANISFPPSTGGSANDITYWALCKAGVPGVADLIVTGAVSPTISVSNGITPIVTTASTFTIS